MPRKIIIDTDPGQDDSVAILLALASPQDLELLGIVAVSGNIGLNRSATNALKIVELAGKTQIPVYAGCARPMRREIVLGTHVHGKTGLDGPDLPDPAIKLQEQHGVDFLIDALRQHYSKTITLCALGPLTNIAMALIKAPDIAERIEKIVLMGGAYFEVGNISPAAEFNIFVDPEAADVVFNSGIPLVVASLDVSHKALCTPARLEAFKTIGNKAGQAVFEMLSFSERFDLNKYGWDGAPLHDPLVTAYLINPDLFTGKLINVSIETQSELTRGMTVADYWQITDKPKNALFLDSVNDQGFYDLLVERLARLP